MSEINDGVANSNIKTHIIYEFVSKHEHVIGFVEKTNVVQCCVGRELDTNEIKWSYMTEPLEICICVSGVFRCV